MKKTETPFKKIRTLLRSKRCLLIVATFFLSFGYWAYLFFFSQMVVVFDSVGYQELGTRLAQDGWVGYFRQGPSREPFYPFLVSLAMRLGDFFSVSYHGPLKCIQIAFLFLTQILSLILLKKLKINDILTGAALLYLGFSPALVNSAFSVYSEIATYPFVLLIILLSAQAWQIFFSKTYHKPILCGLGLGLGFVVVTLTKGIFELITPLMMVPYLVFWVKSLFRKGKTLGLRVTVFLIAFFLTFEGSIFLYKSANKKHNGTFTLTDRGAWPLYGNTARRMEAMTPQRVLAGLAFVPGEGVCKSLFSDDSCVFWSANQSDAFGFAKLQEVAQKGLSPSEIDKTLISLSIQKAMQNPFQYAFFTLLEGIKMFFWESTKIGWVDYPSGLSRVFDWTPFKNGLRLLVSFLSFLGLLHALRLNLLEKKHILSLQSPPAESTAVLFSITTFIVLYIVCHSFFFILTRYALPIAPLYLILTASLFQARISRR